MAKFDSPILPQKFVEVDGEGYMITALAATKALEYQILLSKEEGLSPTQMKQLIVTSVTKDNMQIDKTFDTIFACKLVHMNKLMMEILKFNYADAFPEDDSEE